MLTTMYSSGQDPAANIEVRARLPECLPRLHAFIRMRADRRLLERESSSDLLHSVCREALEAGHHQFPTDAHFAKWLCAIAIAKLVDRERHWSAGKRAAGRPGPRRTLHIDEETELAAVYANFETPSRHASRREQIARMERAMAELDEDHREVIALARILELPHAEIAATMQRSEAAVRQLLARALVRLGQILVGGAGTAAP